MDKIKILIADSEEIIRIGLRTLLRETHDLIVIGESADTDTAIQSATKLLPNILILDLNPPKMDALRIIEQLKRDQPAIKILMYSNDKSEETFFKVFHAGAEGYLFKDSPARYILDAIHSLHDGNLFFGPRISEIMLQRFLTQPPDTVSLESPQGDNLTKREVEVLTLIALGMTNQEIAEKLFISALTVHTHRTNLMKKLNVHGTAQLVHYAIEHGLMSKSTEQIDS